MRRNDGAPGIDGVSIAEITATPEGEAQWVADTAAARMDIVVASVAKFFGDLEGLLLPSRRPIEVLRQSYHQSHPGRINAYRKKLPIGNSFPPIFESQVRPLLQLGEPKE